jgi:hypothetical protein
MKNDTKAVGKKRNEEEKQEQETEIPKIQID